MLDSKLRLAHVEILEMLKHLNLDKLGAVLGDDVAEKFFLIFIHDFPTVFFVPMIFHEIQPVKVVEPVEGERRQWESNLERLIEI